TAGRGSPPTPPSTTRPRRPRPRPGKASRFVPWSSFSLRRGRSAQGSQVVELGGILAQDPALGALRQIGPPGDLRHAVFPGAIVRVVRRPDNALFADELGRHPYGLLVRLETDPALTREVFTRF